MRLPDRPWILENDVTNVLATAVGASLLGAAITGAGWLLRGAPGQDGWVAIGMLVFGLLFLCGGIGMLIAMPRETTTVDPQRKQIVVTTRTRFGDKEHVIRFSQVERLTCQSAGDNEGGTETFHVQAHLTTGKTVALYAQHYSGTKDADVAEERRQRLGAMIIAAYPGKAATLLPEPPRGLLDRVHDWSRGR